MADKKISDFTASSAVDIGDVNEIETGAGNSRKVRAGVDGTACGTAFPGPPTTDDRFYRTDRRIEYFYDGTRWLSTFQVAFEFGAQDNLNAATATTSHRASNPYFGEADIYIERFVFTSFNSATTAANYFTAQLKARDSGSTNIGSAASAQNDTINQFVGHGQDVNTVVASTVPGFEVTYTETGAATSYLTSAMVFRLVG